LIFASIGLSTGVLGTDLYGALLVVVLVTTMITPPLLRVRLGTGSSDSSGDSPLEGSEEPDAGWLEMKNGSVTLRGIPPVVETVSLALHTALRLERSRPSDELLDWFGRNRNAPLVFDPDDTPLFIRILRSGNSHTWRFLEVTGVLERALPEIAASLATRRTDIHDLDPLGALRFPILENLRDIRPDGFVHDDELILAALSADVCEDSQTGMQCAVDLATRLGRIAEADRIASIVADAHLLRSGAGDPHAFDEHEILQLATHLASPVHARQAYTLARAFGELPRWREEALEQRYALVQEALDHPELTGTGATNLAAARMQAAQRLAATPAAVERLRHASTTYLLAHDPVELARQARLVEPLPRSGVVRVAVTPDPEPEHWKIDVACRDTAGLLTHLTKSLADAGLDVVSAAIATWADGAVLDTFTIRATARPSARVLALAMEDGLRARLEPHDVHDVVLEFDNDSMPWNTVCIASGPDQPGALYAVSAAFSAADVVVHTARVSSSRGRIPDRFLVSDRVGRKLDSKAMGRVREALAGNRQRRLFGLRRG
jgi:UTP:GlnB (protein PII) uridylyltransferase